MTKLVTPTQIRNQLSDEQIKLLFDSYSPRPDAIELNGCLVIGKDHLGKEIVEPVFSNEEPDFYAIYWHIPGRGVEWLEDFNTLEEAELGKARVEKICNLPVIQEKTS